MLTNTLNVWMIALGYGLDNLFCLKFTVQFEIPKKKKIRRREIKMQEKNDKISFLIKMRIIWFQKIFVFNKITFIIDKLNHEHLQ